MGFFHLKHHHKNFVSNQYMQYFLVIFFCFSSNYFLLASKIFFLFGIVEGLFESHIAMGKAHGITKTEIVEVITQLAFYCGWPLAWKAFPIIDKIYGEEEREK